MIKEKDDNDKKLIRKFIIKSALINGLFVSSAFFGVFLALLAAYFQSEIYIILLGAALIMFVIGEIVNYLMAKSFVQKNNLEESWIKKISIRVALLGILAAILEIAVMIGLLSIS